MPRPSLRLAVAPSRLTALLLSAAFYVAVCTAIGTAICTATPARAQTPAPLSLDRAVALAAETSDLLKASASQVRAAREGLVAAGELPDPVLRFGIDNLPVDGAARWRSDADPMTMRTLGLRQELTRDDKRSARSARARSEVDAARIERQAAATELRQGAALAWLDRSFQQSQRELLQAEVTQALLQVDAAEALYRAGKAPQADVFAARGEVEALRDRADAVERDIALATTALARWTGDAARAPLASRPAFELPAWTRSDLAATLARQPALAMARQREQAATADAAVARAAQREDWSVELALSQRAANNTTMLSLSLSLPLQWDSASRQDRQLAARLAAADAARARGDDLKRAVEAEVRALRQAWDSHGVRLNRHDATLLPLAAQRSEAALSSYRAGSGTLTAVLQARRAELEVQTSRLRIESERARAWARLNYLLPDEAETVTPQEEVAR